MAVFWTITLRWWARCTAFLLLAILCCFILTIIAPDWPIMFHYCLAAVLATVVVEYFRPHNALYLAGLLPDIFVVRQVVLAAVAALAIIPIFAICAYMAGASLELIFANMHLHAIGVIAAAACVEELMFRGTLFQAFEERFGLTLATLASTLLFTALHSLNPGFSAMAAVNVALANIVLVVLFVRSRSLLPCIAFHCCWNCSLANILGISVSGLDLGSSSSAPTAYTLLSQNFPFVFGKMFGLEEGLAATAILSVAGLWLGRHFTISPYIYAKLFRRTYAESHLHSKCKLFMNTAAIQ